jgi:ATP-dependent Clp protease ATP-binding subunit ClpC
MFERFTDRSRRVLVYAQDQARDLNDAFIGTEHILLGLILEADGVAAKVLGSAGASYDAVREKIKATRVSTDPSSGAPPFTPRAKKVLELSLREALQLGHNYIGTEHILLGLVREGNGVGAQILLDLGVDLAHARENVMGMMSGPSGREFEGSRRQSSARTRCFASSCELLANDYAPTLTRPRLTAERQQFPMSSLTNFDRAGWNLMTR